MNYARHQVAVRHCDPAAVDRASALLNAAERAGVDLDAMNAARIRLDATMVEYGEALQTTSASSARGARRRMAVEIAALAMSYRRLVRAVDGGR